MMMSLLTGYTLNTAENTSEQREGCDTIYATNGTVSAPLGEQIAAGLPLNKKAHSVVIELHHQENKFDRTSTQQEAKQNQHSSPDRCREDCLINDVGGDNSVANKSTDQQLVERVQRGDKKAFDLLVLKYQGKVGALVSRYVGDSQEVLDVTQEAFIKAYRALKSFRGDSAFYTWLYRISINTAKNYLVAKSRRPPGVDVDAQDAEHFSGENHLKDTQSPEKMLYKTELERVLNDAIKMLPEDLRMALTLREFDGLSYEDIADVMGCPVGTVRSRIFRARDAVDAKIAPYLDGHNRN